MLNIHPFSQGRVNTITEVSEKSAIQEIKVLANTSLKSKGSCDLFHGIHRNADLSSQELS